MTGQRHLAVHLPWLGQLTEAHNEFSLLVRAEKLLMPVARLPIALRPIPWKMHARAHTGTGVEFENIFDSEIRSARYLKFTGCSPSFIRASAAAHIT